MAKKVKCPLCNTMNDKENTKEISKRYYCIECAEKEEKRKEKTVDGWDELFNYICDLYNIDNPTGFMFKQIKDFRDNYNYTNKGILLTLKYYHETLGNEVKEDAGLGIVIYYYEKAKKHFIETREVKKHLENFQENEEVKTIKVKKNFFERDKKKELPVDTSWEEEDCLID